MAEPIARTGDARRYSLRCAPEALAEVQSMLGLQLPQTPCRAFVEGDRAALWLGPDEWLLLLPTTGPVPSTPLIPGPYSLVEISDRQIGLGVTGPQAETILAIGCPLDLDPLAFPMGMCTRTLIGKAEVVLWRREPEHFHIEVWRSFAAYVERLLAAGASEADG